IRLSAAYLRDVERADGSARSQAELEGLVVFALVSTLWRPRPGTDVPGGLVSGVADYARLRAGLAPPHWTRSPSIPSPDDDDNDHDHDPWASGFSTVAFFLDWVDTHVCRDVVPALTAALVLASGSSQWSPALWEAITGVPLAAAWTAYQQDLLADVAAQRRALHMSPVGPDGLPVYEYSADMAAVDPAAAARFRLAIPDPVAWLAEATAGALRALYAGREADAPRHIAGVRLVVRDFDGVAHTVDAAIPVHGAAGAAGAAGNGTRPGKAIHVSVRYMASVFERVGQNVELLRGEMDGVMLHEAVHVVQHNGFGSAPGWFVEGLADLVRLRGGLAPPHWTRQRGGRWTDGYSRTAYFLDWLEPASAGTGTRTGIGQRVQQLNATLAMQPWTRSLFEQQMQIPAGHTMASMWDRFQASL
ncbi:hypothetical protein BC831DRAFT_390398, partial [Entophlyctis helioformis]